MTCICRGLYVFEQNVDSFRYKVPSMAVKLTRFIVITGPAFFK